MKNIKTYYSWPVIYTKHVCIRRNLNVLSVRDENKRFSEKYFQRLSGHINPLLIALLDDRRRI